MTVAVAAFIDGLKAATVAAAKAEDFRRRRTSFQFEFEYENHAHKSEFDAGDRRGIFRARRDSNLHSGIA
jgi:hypothetical protein